MRLTKIFLILAFYIFYFIFIFTLSADTIIDSVYADPILDGAIHFSQNTQSLEVNNWIPGMDAGDAGESMIASDPNSYARSYVSFQLLEIQDGYELDSVYVRLYQYNSIGDGDIFGNQEPFPLFYGQELPCIMDHIDYGNQLDFSDWTKGNPGDPGTLHTNIGCISNNGDDGYRYLDITEYVLDDYNNDRDKTQYRIRFEVDTDWDYLTDALGFSTSNSAAVNHRPLIFIYFTSNISIEDNQFPIVNNFSLYPNPVKSELICKFSMVKQNEVEISLFNIKGQKVRNVLNRFVRAGDNSLTIDMKCLNEGIYLLKVDVRNSNPVIKKIVKLN